MAYSLDNCSKEREVEWRTRNIIQNFQALHLNKPTVVQLVVGITNYKDFDKKIGH